MNMHIDSAIFGNSSYSYSNGYRLLLCCFGSRNAVLSASSPFVSFFGFATASLVLTSERLSSVNKFKVKVRVKEGLKLRSVESS